MIHHLYSPRIITFCVDGTDIENFTLIFLLKLFVTSIPDLLLLVKVYLLYKSIFLHAVTGLFKEVIGYKKFTFEIYFTCKN